jgi:hypothetical protein
MGLVAIRRQNTRKKNNTVLPATVRWMVDCPYSVGILVTEISCLQPTTAKRVLLLPQVTMENRWRTLGVVTKDATKVKCLTNVGYGVT